MNSMLRKSFLIFLGALPLLAEPGVSKAPSPLVTKVEDWRKNYEKNLQQVDGWLAVAGLFWLQPGETTVGSATTNKVVLPAGPAKAGTVTFREGQLLWRGANGVSMTLATDKGGKPTVLEIDRLKLFAIDRNGKIGLRLRDPQSKMVREFGGTHWFPIQPAYSVVGTFKPYKEPKEVLVNDVTGNKLKYMSPGEVEFTIKGRKYSLEPVIDEEQLFFVFKDGTSGKQTYGGGRMLYAPMPDKNNKTLLEFNIAKNPPCVWTPYATCPLPTKRNTLPMALTAGELVPEGH